MRERMTQDRSNVADRRRSRRFAVDWSARIAGVDSSGRKFQEETSLYNLSSSGAFIRLAAGLNIGARIELAIQIPLKKNNWMKYAGEIVRVETSPMSPGVAIKFDSPRPIFGR